MRDVGNKLPLCCRTKNDKTKAVRTCLISPSQEKYMNLNPYIAYSSLFFNSELKTLLIINTH